MIKINDLHRNWKEFRLTGIDLEIADGEYFVILGPTGAGKTLLLELIAGFHQPDGGKISIGGKNVTGFPPEKRNIGFVYQDYSLFPHMNAEKNIEFGMRMRGLMSRGGSKVKAKSKSKIEEVAGYLNIGHLLHRHSQTLSGGEQQRVALARALVIEPDVLLLDEPLSALDPGTQAMTRKILKGIHNDSKLTVIHVTHDQTEARILADRIAVMMDGRIVQIGTPDEVFDRPIDVRVAHFVGVENVLKGEVTASSNGISMIDIGGKMLEAISECPVGDTVYACLRPENVTLSKTDINSSARNSFEGRLLEMDRMGALVRVKVDLDGGFLLNAFVTKPSAEELGLAFGEPLVVSFKASAVHVV
ncbi:MAG: ATP-binding cassette domain-containing protein [Methanosarcinaceae archaeon]|nr:ATP-binding cassette domain-containing protein [Methanosarcinaceae archaeon]MDF1533555.1 ATP-binding cassette domain-containing protein [Methanosarcinaceae archaeon]